MAYTAEQVLALAKNNQARKNARALANSSKWLSLATDGRAIWGEISGKSASTAYKVRVDLTEPAFKCDCASRQQPCKYAIGLLLLYAEDPTAFIPDKPPQWVSTWITARDNRNQKKLNNEIVDPEAQKKRMAEREAKVIAGMEELDLWLRDLIRNGLADVQGKGYDFWDAPAARMVDAQAKGIANQLRDLAGLSVSSERWHEQMLERLSLLYLLSEGFRHRDQLPITIQEDLRTVIGWSQKRDELLPLPTTHGRWLAVGLRREDDDTLQSQRIWLWSLDDAPHALLLDFAFGNTTFDHSILIGSSIEADLIYYPSNYQLRAIVKEKRTFDAPGVVSGVSIPQAISAYAEALACNPWVGLFPMLLDAVVPIMEDGRWWLVDADDRSLQLTPQVERNWKLLAHSGGHPVTVFGEWNGTQLLPLSVWVNDQIQPL